MKYKIRIDKERPKLTDAPAEYDRFDTIYEQIVDDLDFREVVKAVNRFENIKTI